MRLREVLFSRTVAAGNCPTTADSGVNLRAAQPAAHHRSVPCGSTLLFVVTGSRWTHLSHHSCPLFSSSSSSNFVITFPAVQWLHLSYGCPRGPNNNPRGPVGLNGSCVVIIRRFFWRQNVCVSALPCED